MKEERGVFAAEDGIRLHYRFYRNDRAKQVLVILHGHGEHSGRYEKFSRYLAGEAVSIAVFDARGAGQSEGPEVYIESLEDYLRDVSSFAHFLKQKYGMDGKFILFGHSLGGLVALHWALRFPHKISALILSSPCFGLKLPSAIVGFNEFLNRWIPRLIYKNPVYPPHLTHNPEEVEHYKKDPLIRRKISVRLLAEMIKWGNNINRIESFDFSFPVYILMAGLERVVDKDRTALIFERIKAPQKRMQVFEGFYHEIFNELGQEKAFDALKACLRESAGGPIPPDDPTLSRLHD